MTIFDDALRAIVATIDTPATAAGLVRRRGGVARRIAWAELSGRLPDGSWAELRLHHIPVETRLQAGLLIYEPLSRGGRTIVAGEECRTYDSHPAEVEGFIVNAVERWLAALAPDARTEDARKP